MQRSPPTAKLASVTRKHRLSTLALESSRIVIGFDRSSVPGLHHKLKGTQKCTYGKSTSSKPPLKLRHNSSHRFITLQTFFSITLLNLKCFDNEEFNLMPITQYLVTKLIYSGILNEVILFQVQLWNEKTRVRF
jgi:hypothetical protein